MLLQLAQQIMIMAGSLAKPELQNVMNVVDNDVMA